MRELISEYPDLKRGFILYLIDFLKTEAEVDYYMNKPFPLQLGVAINYLHLVHGLHIQMFSKGFAITRLINGVDVIICLEPKLVEIPTITAWYEEAVKLAFKLIIKPF